MAKFLHCEDNAYFNIDMISEFGVAVNNGNCSVFCLVKKEVYIIKKNMSEDVANEFLDNLINDINGGECYGD